MMSNDDKDTNDKNKNQNTILNNTYAARIN